MLFRSSAKKTTGIQTEVAEGLHDKLYGENFGLEPRTMDQELGLHGFGLTKPRSTWKRINRMDFGLGEISKAFKLPSLGKRNSKLDAREGTEADSETRVVKRGKGEQHDIDFYDISAGWRSTLARSNEDLKLELPRA